GATRDLHSFPTRRSSDLGAEVADRHRVIDMVSAEKKGVDCVDADEAEFLSYALHEPVKPAAVVRDECVGDLACRGSDAFGCERRDRKSTRLNSSHDQISY